MCYYFSLSKRQSVKLMRNWNILLATSIVLSPLLSSLQLACRSCWFLRPFLNYSGLSQLSLLAKVDRSALRKVPFPSICAYNGLNPSESLFCLENLVERSKEVVIHSNIQNYFLPFFFKLWSLWAFGPLSKLLQMTDSFPNNSFCIIMYPALQTAITLLLFSTPDSLS